MRYISIGIISFWKELRLESEGSQVKVTEGQREPYKGMYGMEMVKRQ